MSTTRAPASFRFFVSAIWEEAIRSGRIDRGVGEYPKPIRLALEMAAHEETERQALRGELECLVAHHGSVGDWRPMTEHEARREAIALAFCNDGSQGFARFAVPRDR